MIRSKIIQLRKKYPRWTLQQIATECKISKQRVHYILKTEMLPTKVFNRSWGKSKYKNCHFCKSLMVRGSGSNYCTNTCKENNLLVEFACNFCGENNKMQKSKMIRKVKQLKQYHFFCNTKCYGKYRTATKRKN